MKLVTAPTVLVAFLAMPALAQDARNCAPRDAVIEHLAENYGETRQSIGLGDNNAVIELFASDATGSWTITITTPNGLTCLVGAGGSFENLNEPLPSKKEAI